MNRRDLAWTTRAIRCFVCAAAFVSYAYFHGGGGWNQNARFAQIRALAEEGRFSIDSFLIYRVDPRRDVSPNHLYRVPVKDGEVSIDQASYALAWAEPGGKAVRLRPASTLPPLAVDSVAVSGDVTFSGGHVFPNKAPGLSLLAAPGYLIVHSTEKLFGREPDDSFTLTVNAWLSSVLSIALVSAIGCALFFQVALTLTDGHVEAALIATLAFAWGTLFFPYSTVLYEHNVMAVAFLSAFSLLLFEARRGGEHRTGPDPAFWAGFAAGCGVAANYIGLPVAALLGVYAVHRLGARRAAVFAAGMAPVFALIGLYDFACFGAPWRLSYTSQNPLFTGVPWERGDLAQGREPGHLFLGVFGPPRLYVLLAILGSPFRGLFYSSPILILGVVGWTRLCGDRRWRAEAGLFAAIFVFFLAFNTCFNGWEGGWATGPRYLIPAIPFLALPVALAAIRFRFLSLTLLLVSVVTMSLATVVDPQAPIVPATPWWRYDPLLDYQLPLFVGSAPRLVAGETTARIARYERTMELAGAPPEVRREHLEAAAHQLAAAAEQGDERFFPLSNRRGPVSANPTGIYEAGFFRLFPSSSAPVRWNSFNVGEFLFPRSRWSLVPLLLVAGSLISAAVRLARRAPPEVRRV